MPAQFAEYADVERPGVKLVTAKQVQLFPTDTSIGILLYILVHATSPSLVESPPTFQLNVTLGSSNQAEGIRYLKVAPSQRDFPFVTKVTYPDGTEQVTALSVDKSALYPAKAVEGHIHFQIAKTATQRIFATSLNIS